MRIYKAMVQSSRTPSAGLNNMTSSQGEAHIQPVYVKEVQTTDKRKVEPGCRSSPNAAAMSSSTLHEGLQQQHVAHCRYTARLAEDL
jgi:hypothetical protein